MSTVPSTLPETPLVSCLLPVYNAAPILDHVLSRLAANTTYPRVELIAVDDGSTDDSLAILERWRDSGRLPGRVQVVSKPNGGAIDTLNAALERASGEVVVQLDADASIETPAWTERMLRVLRADDRVGVVTVKVVSDDGFIHACGVELTRPTGMLDRPSQPAEPPGSRTWHDRARRVREGEWPGEDRPAEVDAGMGCCLMYRREDALAAGGYDRGYSPVWFDDADLCLGIRARGRKVLYLPDVRVMHHITGRVSSPTGTRARAKAVVKRVVPAGVRRRLRSRFDPNGGHTPAQRERLRHHYAYWRSKWGWDPLNPSLDDIRARWGGTEVAWALEPERRRAGEEIVAALGGGGRPSRIDSVATLRRWVAADLARYDRALLSLLVHEPQVRWQVRLRIAEYVTNTRGRLLGMAARWRVKAGARRLGYSIPLNVLGPGLRLPHYGTLIISDQARIGAGCTIHPGTTIGLGRGQAPTIGDGVYFGPGVKAFGGITIGDGVRAGANCVISRSVEPHVTVAGVPARVLYRNDDDQRFSRTTGAAPTETVTLPAEGDSAVPLAEVTGR